MAKGAKFRGVVKVVGVRELNAKLRKLDSNAPKGLRDAGNEAADIVVKVARPRVPLGPGRGGHARNSLRASSTRIVARVTAGGKRYPYYPWLDFGGSVGPRKSVKRSFKRTGRYIWRAFADHRQRVMDTYVDALNRIVRKAGL